MLRPLTDKGSRPKQKHELNQSERATLNRQKEKAEYLRRNGKSTERGR